MNAIRTSLTSVITMSLAAVLVVVGAAPAAQDDQQGEADHHAEAPQHDPSPKANADAAGDLYLLGVDPVTGEALPENPVIITHEDREFRFASQENGEKFLAHPEAYIPKVDEQIVKAQSPHYPLATCVVSGEKLGEMEEPIDFVYRNRLVRFCCKGCKKDFLKDPDAYLSKIDDAVIAGQKSSYPLKTCVVSDEEFGGDMGEPIDRVYGTRLVRFCCKSCPKDFRKNPAAYLQKIDAAADNDGDHDESAGHTEDHPDAEHGESAEHAEH